MSTPTLHVGRREIKLAAPRSIATCYDIVAALRINGNRGFAAALGVCCISPVRKEWPNYLGDPLAFGGQVIDALLEQGGTLDEIIDAGEAAAQLCMAKLPDMQRVEELEGNSDSQETSTE